MRHYRLNNTYKSLDATSIWNKLIEYIDLHKVFYSATGIEYHAEYQSDSIRFGTDTQISTERPARKETIYKHSMVKFISILQRLPEINSEIMNEYLSQDVKPLFPKRTPVLGLLLTTQVLIKEE